MVVEAPPGFPVAKIKEEWTFCGSSFTIVDERDEAIYTISAECCPGASLSGTDVHFQVKNDASFTSDGNPFDEVLGKIPSS